MNTKDYLESNDLTVGSALMWTFSNLEFLREEKHEKIVINYNKPTKETMSEAKIIERLYDLWELQPTDGEYIQAIAEGLVEEGRAESEWKRKCDALELPYDRTHF